MNEHTQQTQSRASEKPTGDDPLASVGTAERGGRGENGRFLAGNQAARGNPVAKKAQLLRVGLMRAVSSGDLRAVIRKLVDLAKSGDVAASRLLLDRVLGPPVEVDLIERIERLEQALMGQ